jgi:BirA family biotin operon repressor/biotin-[acetyl-CoA-carboxylase] ligase
VIGRALPDLARASALIAERGGALGAPLHVLDETTSTNDEAKRASKDGAPHGSTWVAESQTAGRGRQGRAWVSPRGENLLVSVLVRVTCPPARLPPLALAAGLAARDAVARALEQESIERNAQRRRLTDKSLEPASLERSAQATLALGEGAGAPEVRLKWPNDVVVGTKKVAGILVEAILQGSRVEAVVVGAGINVHTRDFPPDIAARATSVALLSSRPPDRAEILADFLAALDRDVSIVAARGLGLVHARLSAADALRGRRVSSESGEGVAEGIDVDGRLLVRRADGVLARWVAGEVHLV